MKLFKAQRASSVLALALDGEKLEAVVVRRAGSSLQARQMVWAGMDIGADGGPGAGRAGRLETILTARGCGNATAW